MESSPRSTVVVLHGADRPPAMTEVEARATVRYTTADRLGSAIEGADVLLVWESRSTALSGAWAAARALRWVHVAGPAVRHLLFPGLRESGVVVTSSPGVFDEPMAEYVLGLVLAFAKDLPGTLRDQQRRRWQHRETERLAGSRALLVGTGPIARAIARKLTAVGVGVAALGAPRAGDPDFGDVRPLGDLRAAVGGYDWVVLALALTEPTAGLVDASVLRAMRPTARLVNIGRSGLVVQPDLVDALDRGELAGAAFDEFGDEPLAPSSPLWGMPNVLISPHMSGDVVGWREELVRRFADNLDRYLTGRPLVNAVDKERAAR
ncbi:D-2-hydroxyacid dehydrogenase [Actinokineospora auranticolor]|uniref:Phosphoglycerate dehydrogenase-like enzyme n=1 Tax=Actinokineospora auranticolor TaxID=155976 RepID=A0A2S6GBI5_9PSEU|nr:D-2-hydroxyacid dehydrogenase [Actinokineospora auranticolor]PPK61346.1 phosphoglycerate dehydrogenase-like enzyme [Actinokineospora auranticolor]